MNRKFILTILFMSVFPSLQSAIANWNNSNLAFQNKSGSANQGIIAGSDSLPGSVTEDWLTELRDENGNKIIGNSTQKLPDTNPEEPGDALQRKVFNGPSPNSQFGKSVSSAGDVNGDGYDDIIVGAWQYNTATGRAYVFYGGLNMNTVADVIITGEAINNYLGISVSSAGDVNADGYSDVIVGAYGHNSNSGRAYIYYGGSAMNNTADVIMNGESTGALFGCSVSCAGDVNDDGYDDVIAGSYAYDSLRGRSYIFYGGQVMNNIPDVIITGDASQLSSGYSVSKAGDVNADGYGDVIIGETGFSSNTGRANIFYGGSSMDDVSDVVLTGETTYSNFGISVASAMDLNADGYSDVIVGASGYNSNTGKVYIFYGASSMDYAPDVTMIGEAVSNAFGVSVASIGDINGDGYSDVIAGASGYNFNSGRAYIYLGGINMDSTSDVIVSGESGNNTFGNCVATAGDVNDDGYSDILVGANGIQRVYLYDYYLKNEISPELTMSGESSGDNFGITVNNAGDVNGDGFDDIIVGADSYNSTTGKAYIFYGGTPMNKIADVTMTGEAVANYFGRSVSGAGDVNGDGYSDVIVGAFGFSSNVGRAYIYYGGNPMNNTADVTMTNAFGIGKFGSSVSGTGDMNGDGYADVIVGAPEYNNSTGLVNIFFGGSSMDNSYDVLIFGEISNNLFGKSVSGAGDFNGDGYGDAVVGAYAYGSGTGRAYVIYGSASGINNYGDLVLNGVSTNTYFGYSCSCAGDVNGDGYSDIIISAVATNFFKGVVFLYYGGNVPDITPDQMFSGESDNNNFGFLLSPGGDINGDGYSDVLIGAGGYASYQGRTYVYLGGTSMNNSPDVTMKGETFNNDFGIAAAIGNFNGDGYSDVVVGSPQFNSYTGKSYVYFGSAISANPILTYVRDVPVDQGGKVNLKWARSSYDVQGNTLITDYLIQRSFPPENGNFSWQNVTSIPASYESFYSYVDNTPSDSITNNTSTFYYRIIARTSSINQNWKSNILYGRSIDNISPPVVSPFNAFSESNNVRLTWNHNSAPDLLNYVLFRSTSQTIDPNNETPFATTSDTTYLDTTPLSGVYYYFIVAQDIHNNYSPVATAQGPINARNLTLYGAIQGMYDPVTDTEIPDTINVRLRDSSSPYASIDSSKHVLLGPLTGQQFSYYNIQDNTPYYVQVTHRNFLETWSANPVTFSGGSSSIAFSVNSIYAYGSNEIQVDSYPYDVYAFYSGDVNHDEVIDLSDLIQIFNDANQFTTGYVVTDVTGDDFVDLSDLTLTFNNAGNFVTVIKP